MSNHALLITHHFALQRSNNVREQAIPQRVGDRGGAYGRRPGAAAQRPSKRGSAFDAGLIGRLRALASYLPLIGKIAVAVIVLGLTFAGYRAAASASFFQVRQVDVQGISRASADQIQQVVHRTVGQSGVWRADLAAVSAQLEHLPWVRTAVVSRLLPDGLRVRITERVPRAVVRNEAGHFIWVDEDAVSLAEMAGSDHLPVLLRGWSEESTKEAHQQNRSRIEQYLILAREWEAKGLSGRVSEVNLADLTDVRVQLAGDDSQVEVRLGSVDLTARLERAFRVLDEERQTALGPYIIYIIMTQKVPVVGHSPLPSRSGSGSSASSVSPVPEPRAGNDSAKPPPAKPATHPAVPRPVLTNTDQPSGDSRKRRVGDQLSH
jgi:cell division protein FtsQ